MDKDNNKGLTRDQLKRFHQDGYLGPLPRFADVELIQDVLTEVRGIIQSPKPHPLYGRYSVRDWHLVSEDIKELSTNSALIASLQSLIGVDLALWRSKIFHKKPGENGTGWHRQAEGARLACYRLAEVGIFANAVALPKDKELLSRIRFGATEITRLGITKSQIVVLAEVIAGVLQGHYILKEASNVVSQLASTFSDFKYSLEDE